MCVLLCSVFEYKSFTLFLTNLIFDHNQKHYLKVQWGALFSTTKWNSWKTRFLQILRNSPTNIVVDKQLLTLRVLRKDWRIVVLSFVRMFSSVALASSPLSLHSFIISLFVMMWAALWCRHGGHPMFCCPMFQKSPAESSFIARSASLSARPQGVETGGCRQPLEFIQRKINTHTHVRGLYIEWNTFRHLNKPGLFMLPVWFPHPTSILNEEVVK